MPIVLVRVDDRLIHGQILEGWLPCVKAEEVLIANDELANDETQTMIMQYAVPDPINLIVDTVDRVAEMLKEETEAAIKRMILVDDPGDALRLIRAGVEFDILNLGNLRENECCTSLSRSVLVGQDTLATLCAILEAGVRVSIQAVPFERAIDLYEVCADITIK
jgi:mannose/fructose/N-acetylgalactosamine-specific phosphotransferase system component IIB